MVKRLRSPKRRAALSGTLRIVTRLDSEEEQRLLADAASYEDSLLEFCAKF